MIVEVAVVAAILVTVIVEGHPCSCQRLHIPKTGNNAHSHERGSRARATRQCSPTDSLVDLSGGSGANGLRCNVAEAASCRSRFGCGAASIAGWTWSCSCGPSAAWESRDSAAKGEESKSCDLD